MLKYVLFGTLWDLLIAYHITTNIGKINIWRFATVDKILIW